MTADLPEDLRIEPLRKGGEPRFFGMTFPRYRPLLSMAALDSFSVAAFCGDEPVGLALGQVQEVGTDVELLSIFVKKVLRHRGIGAALLRAFEDECRRRKLRALSAVYSTELESAEVLEHLLTAAGWGPPVSRMSVGRFERNRLDDMRWVWRYELPEGHTVSPWHALSDIDRTFIRSVADVPNWYDGTVADPFSQQEIAEPLNSLLLKKGTDVIGWVVTHRINPDTIRYTHLFVRRDLEAFGVLLPLFAESLRRHRADGPPKGIFAIYHSNEAFIRFLHRRIEPHLLSLAETRQMSKTLT